MPVVKWPIADFAARRGAVYPEDSWTSGLFVQRSAQPVHFSLRFWPFCLPENPRREMPTRMAVETKRQFDAEGDDDTPLAEHTAAWLEKADGTKSARISLEPQLAIYDTDRGFQHFPFLTEAQLAPFAAESTVFLCCEFAADVEAVEMTAAEISRKWTVEGFEQRSLRPAPTEPSEWSSDGVVVEAGGRRADLRLTAGRNELGHVFFRLAVDRMPTNARLFLRYALWIEDEGNRTAINEMTEEFDCFWQSEHGMHYREHHLYDLITDFVFRCEIRAFRFETRRPFALAGPPETPPAVVQLVASDGQQFQVEKDVLAANSLYFRRQCEAEEAGRLPEHRSHQANAVVRLKNCRPEVVKLMARFLENGDLGEWTAAAVPLLAAAVRLEICPLEDLCAKHLCSSIQMENVFARVDVPHPAVREHALRFLLRNYAAVRRLPEWPAFAHDHGDVLALLLDRVLL
ncbi:hypothetical protein M3Y99_00815000 [Aphelenchoides fujianensis]|nr:hypothetical protein M3Y99_00815000 [Aphelenchoides fujianensis]